MNLSVLLTTATLAVACTMFVVSQAEQIISPAGDGLPLKRERRSSLLTQILYEELRTKLQKEWPSMSMPVKRHPIEPAVLLRQRRASTPESPVNFDTQQFADEVHDLSNRLKKRSLMALILKDTLKHRLEEESKHGHHREIVWGTQSRRYTNPYSVVRYRPRQIQLSPGLTSSLSDLMENLNNLKQQHQQQQMKDMAEKLTPMTIVIKRKQSNL